MRQAQLLPALAALPAAVFLLPAGRCPLAPVLLPRPLRCPRLGWICCPPAQLFRVMHARGRTSVLGHALIQTMQGFVEEVQRLWPRIQTAFCRFSIR